MIAKRLTNIWFLLNHSVVLSFIYFFCLLTYSAYHFYVKKFFHEKNRTTTTKQRFWLRFCFCHVVTF